MPDPRFFASRTPISVDEIAKMVGAVLFRNQPNSTFSKISRVAALSESDLRHAAVFCADQSAFDKLESRSFGLCITSAKLNISAVGDGQILLVENPKYAFAQLAAALHASLEEEEGNTANYNGDVTDAKIHPSAVLGLDIEIGAGSSIGPQCYIGQGVKIGKDVRIGAGCVITHSVIGDHVDILSGARIGQAGFGFVEYKKAIVRIPQLGRVILEGHNEIGANTTIDRGALDDTIVGRGAKIDNLVQIGHNVRIGENCIIAAQTGISGSCVIGNGVMMGGQVGLSDHLTIGDGAQLAAQSGLMRDVPPGERWGGSPARPIKEWLRESAKLARLAKGKNGKTP